LPADQDCRAGYRAGRCGGRAFHETHHPRVAFVSAHEATGHDDEQKDG
jgi:hypothetical protein